MTPAPEDLFTWAATRPRPGRGSDTSRAAAPTASEAAALRRAVLEAYREHGPMTADECADRLRLSVLSIRPRCTELKRDRLLFDSGTSRPNRSGKSAAVLTASQCHA